MTNKNFYPEAHTLPDDLQKRIKAQFRRDLDEHVRTVEYAIVALTMFECECDSHEHIHEEDRDTLIKLKDMLMKGVRLTGSFLSEARSIAHKYVEGPLFEIAAWREGLVQIDEVHT